MYEGLLSTGPTPSIFKPFRLDGAVKAADERGFNELMNEWTVMFVEHPLASPASAYYEWSGDVRV